MSNIKFNIFELQFPEPPKYSDYDIVWWKKGNEKDGFWYKAESPAFKIICLGDSIEEATNNVIKKLTDGYINET